MSYFRHRNIIPSVMYFLLVVFFSLSRDREMCLPNLKPTWTWKAGLPSPGLWESEIASCYFVLHGSHSRQWRGRFHVSLWGCIISMVCSQQTASIQTRPSKPEAHCLFLRFGAGSMVLWWSTCLSGSTAQWWSTDARGARLCGGALV